MTLDRRQTVLLDGSAGAIETVANEPRGEVRAIALVAHPHPLYGGTLDNKVTQTLANAFANLDYVAVRINFRGVGASAGSHDEGIGETEDMLVAHRYAIETWGALPVFLAGFSFGCFVQYRVSQRIDARRLVLVAPAVKRFPMAAPPPGTLVIHGELDDTAPLADALDWARPFDQPVTVIPGADHFFHRRLGAIRSLVETVCRL